MVVASINGSCLRESLRVTGLDSLVKGVGVLPPLVAERARVVLVLPLAAASPLVHKAKLVLALRSEEEQRVIPSARESGAKRMAIGVAVVLVPIVAM